MRASTAQFPKQCCVIFTHALAVVRIDQIADAQIGSPPARLEIKKDRGIHSRLPRPLRSLARSLARILPLRLSFIDRALDRAAAKSGVEMNDLCYGNAASVSRKTRTNGTRFDSDSEQEIERTVLMTQLFSG